MIARSARAAIYEDDAPMVVGNGDGESVGITAFRGAARNVIFHSSRFHFPDRGTVTFCPLAIAERCAPRHD